MAKRQSQPQVSLLSFLSAPKKAKSTMTEKRLNNCLMLHVHKEFTDSLDLISVAKIFVSAYDERKKYFGNYD